MTSKEMSLEALVEIASPADPLQVRAEVQALRERGVLAVQGDFEVFISASEAIPQLLHEVCRLREICFRAVGEGSGKALDRDRFDDHYLHLVLWDRVQERVAGGYRLGCTDVILEKYGREGLYTSTLFEFEGPFLDRLTPGLELGRSFVAGAYQKSLSPLMALWKGLAAFVADQPRYARLFGPVSISGDYTSISKGLIVRFLRDKKWNAELGPLVKPFNPFVGDGSDISPRLESVEQVSARVADTEPDGKGIPVLLRQYLKLNATILEFNIDPDFANCLDALILVDLRDAPAAVLGRYMGKEAYRKFMGE